MNSESKANKAILYSVGASLPTPTKRTELVCIFELSFKKVSTRLQGLKKKKNHIYFPDQQKLD